MGRRWFFLWRKIGRLKKTCKLRRVGRRVRWGRRWLCRSRGKEAGRAGCGGGFGGRFGRGRACFPNAALQKGILTRTLGTLNNHERDIVLDALFDDNISWLMRQRDI
jgi:hypothetical protein